MNKKRFDVIIKEEPRKEIVTDDGIPCTARHCAMILNEFYDENKELEKRVMILEDKIKGLME